MPRTRVYGHSNAETLADNVRQQGGRRVKIRKVVGYEGQHDDWYLVTWNPPEPWNIHHHLWWIVGILMAAWLWQINR